uniref:META3 n=1 Tax=Phallusia mammillata TaxID=59560 RepID=A0A6F9DSY1_9ASCI|nr:META3 [Phallusia mammillata]
MGQKTSSDRRLPFIEPLIARTALRHASVGNRNGSRDVTSPPKRSRRHSNRDGHHRRNTNHGHSNRYSASGMQSECPHRLDVLLDMPAVGPEIQKQHGWNSEDKSINVFVKEGDLIMHRHPVAQSTDGARGKVGYTRGLHCWEVTWNTRQRGTHAMVLACALVMPLSLVWVTVHLWDKTTSPGVGTSAGTSFSTAVKSTGTKRKPIPLSWSPTENFVVPEKVLVVLDMDEGTLSFVADKQYLGVAFRGLKGKTLYPVISCVWGHCEVGIRYINGLDPAPLPLAELCRRRIRMSVGQKHLHEVSELPLPHLLKEYVLYR